MLEHMDVSEQISSPEQVPAYVRGYASKHNLGLPLMASRNQRLVLLSPLIVTLVTYILRARLIAVVRARIGDLLRSASLSGD